MNIPLSLKEPLLQRDLVAFEQSFAKQLRLGGATAHSSNIIAGANIQAAMDAGWVLAPPVLVRKIIEAGQERTEYLYNGQNVLDMLGGAVREIGRQVEAAYNRATEPPPN